MRTTYDICIRGGGAVGMSLALALSRQGLSIALQSLPRGAAGRDVRTYALNARSMELLDSLKVWEALPQSARTPVYDMQVSGDEPGALLRFSAYEQGVQALAWIVDATELEAVLETAVGFAPHVTRCAPGEPVPATLLAVCDGRDSVSRRRLGVHVDTHTYGQRGLAARLICDQPHNGLAWQWFRSPDILALLPFDRPEAGHGYGLVWSLPDREAARLQALDEPAFEQALAQATQGRAGTLRLASARAAWPLVHTRCEPLCGPGWALLGDAAHVVHPLAGQGLNLGLADVEALSRVIAQREPHRGLGDEQLLRRYARERWLPTRAMGGLTDSLLHLFAHDASVARLLRNHGLRLVNAAVPLKRMFTRAALRS